MKLHPLASALVLAFGILSAPPLSVAEGLPDLGEAAQTEFSPAMERRIGESIMLEIRRDPAWLDDPEVNGYLNRLGNRLSSQSEEARQEFEFFALRDSTLNAFAMPGGFVGVHTGLILAAASESELASVLAHEISHVTQHHLARLMNKSGQGQVTSLLALAVAILAARSSPDLAVGAAMAGQGAAIQRSLPWQVVGTLGWVLTCVHLPPVQPSSVQGNPSSQAMRPPALQLPCAHRSSLLQGSPSSQLPCCWLWLQLPPAQ